MADPTANENATKQWPNAICSGPIRYGKADNYDGFYLADAAHGIPTFASVADASPATIRGQHVRVFNYPGQTEAIAAQLVDRWNAYGPLRAENERLRAALTAAADKADRIERIIKVNLGRQDEKVKDAQSFAYEIARDARAALSEASS